LDAFLLGRNAPRTWTETAWHFPLRTNYLAMREIAVSRLGGNGIEIGAGASPLPIPLRCHVRYVDLYDSEGLRQKTYIGHVITEIIEPDILAPFEDLAVVRDSSVDFVATCHVIEHTRDPIGAIAGAWRKLRPGGQIVLVVPEITRTFDRDRRLTTLDHLVEDYLHPDQLRLRDQEHFREFYSLAFPTPPENYEVVWRSGWEAAHPIHYHTWNYSSFAEMIRWMVANSVIEDVAEVWSQPPLDESTGCNEFWYVIRKAPLVRLISSQPEAYSSALTPATSPAAAADAPAPPPR
jgi:SAM-dependent methyltransferase